MSYQIRYTNKLDNQEGLLLELAKCLWNNNTNRGPAKMISILSNEFQWFFYKKMIIMR